MLLTFLAISGFVICCVNQCFLIDKMLGYNTIGRFAAGSKIPGEAKLTNNSRSNINGDPLPTPFYIQFPNFADIRWKKNLIEMEFKRKRMLIRDWMRSLSDKLEVSSKETHDFVAGLGISSNETSTANWNDWLLAIEECVLEFNAMETTPPPSKLIWPGAFQLLTAKLAQLLPTDDDDEVSTTEVPYNRANVLADVHRQNLGINTMVDDPRNSRLTSNETVITTSTSGMSKYDIIASILHSNEVKHSFYGSPEREGSPVVTPSLTEVQSPDRPDEVIRECQHNQGDRTPDAENDALLEESEHSTFEVLEWSNGLNGFRKATSLTDDSPIRDFRFLYPFNKQLFPPPGTGTDIIGGPTSTATSDHNSSILNSSFCSNSPARAHPVVVGSMKPSPVSGRRGGHPGEQSHEIAHAHPAHTAVENQCLPTILEMEIPAPCDLSSGVASGASVGGDNVWQKDAVITKKECGCQATDEKTEYQHKEMETQTIEFGSESTVGAETGLQNEVETIQKVEQENDKGTAQNSVPHDREGEHREMETQTLEFENEAATMEPIGTTVSSCSIANMPPQEHQKFQHFPAESSIAKEPPRESPMQEVGVLEPPIISSAAIKIDTLLIEYTPAELSADSSGSAGKGAGTRVVLLFPDTVFEPAVTSTPTSASASTPVSTPSSPLPPPQPMSQPQPQSQQLCLAQETEADAESVNSALTNVSKEEVRKMVSLLATRKLRRPAAALARRKHTSSAAAATSSKIPKKGCIAPVNASVETISSKACEHRLNPFDAEENEQAGEEEPLVLEVSVLQEQIPGSTFATGNNSSPARHTRNSGNSSTGLHHRSLLSTGGGSGDGAAREQQDAQGIESTNQQQNGSPNGSPSRRNHGPPPPHLPHATVPTVTFPTDPAEANNRSWRSFWWVLLLVVLFFALLSAGRHYYGTSTGGGSSHGRRGTDSAPSFSHHHQHSPFEPVGSLWGKDYSSAGSGDSVGDIGIMSLKVSVQPRNARTARQPRSGDSSSNAESQKSAKKPPFTPGDDREEREKGGGGRNTIMNATPLGAFRRAWFKVRLLLNSAVNIVSRPITSIFAIFGRNQGRNRP